MVLTSRVTEIDEVMSMNMGADDFVPKPIALACWWRASRRNSCVAGSSETQAVAP